MKKKELADLWVERVDYDLNAADTMLKGGHLLYVVFLCQQASEKMLKALWVHQREDSPPYTHNLATLAESVELDISAEQKSFLDLLNRFYIVGRYPSFKQKLASDLTKREAASLLLKTKEFVQWCRTFIRM